MVSAKEPAVLIVLRERSSSAAYGTNGVLVVSGGSTLGGAEYAPGPASAAAGVGSLWRLLASLLSSSRAEAMSNPQRVKILRSKKTARFRLHLVALRSQALHQSLVLEPLGNHKVPP